MVTRVCITIDTEFSIAGAFADRRRCPVAEPVVWCNVDGRSEGMGFLLDCFSHYDLTATFFIEALHRFYFQQDPMRAIAHRILGQGHEVQLHAHPCWSVFRHPDWIERVRTQPRQDDFFGRCEHESLALIRNGIETFLDWGVPAPKVFRSGSLQHDDALYRALARSGIPYSSNVGLAIFDSGDDRYRLYSGCHDRHGVLECPVLTFKDWSIGARSHIKSLTIAGTSFREMRTLLEAADAAGMGLVVILTHPFEYVQSRDASFAHVRRHAVNQQRLRKLCGFLAENRHRFVATGMAAAIEATDASTAQNVLLSGTPWQSACRLLTQIGYDQFGKLALARSRRTVR